MVIIYYYVPFLILLFLLLFITWIRLESIAQFIVLLKAFRY